MIKKTNDSNKNQNEPAAGRKPLFHVRSMCSEQFPPHAVSTRRTFYFPGRICPSRKIKPYGPETRILSVKCLNLRKIKRLRRRVEYFVTCYFLGWIYSRREKGNKGAAALVHNIKKYEGKRDYIFKRPISVFFFVESTILWNV